LSTDTELKQAMSDSENHKAGFADGLGWVSGIIKHKASKWEICKED
jgi:hypothetical protein